MSKTNLGLVDYAKKMVGTPYWWGTFGQYGTKALFEQKKNQYPYAYNWQYQEYMKDKKVHDCAGLIKGYLWSETPESSPVYIQSQDCNAAGFYMRSPSHGHITDMPDIPGLLIFYGNLTHVGVYVGNGEVVQCANLDVGCVKTKISSDPSWTYWGKCPWIDYCQEDESEVPDYVALLCRIRNTLLNLVDLIDEIQ